jgi:tRNA (guanine-N7-)-methyltransferase
MRGIRTFHPRRGRLSARHHDALDRLMPMYGVPAEGPIDPSILFDRDLPLVVEIGSGMGETTVEMACADPGRGYLAVEIHTPGVANLLAVVEERGLTNVRVLFGDAPSLLRERVAAGTLDAVHAFFPDPWPKARHHKRRLFQRAHVALLASRLRPGGTLWCATDWAQYAAVMVETLGADPLLIPGKRRVPRPVTKFEQRGRDAGRAIVDLVYTRR